MGDVSGPRGFIVRILDRAEGFDHIFDGENISAYTCVENETDGWESDNRMESRKGQRDRSARFVETGLAKQVICKGCQW